MTDYTHTMEWLLKQNYPLSRYNTLIHILEKDGSDSEVQETLEEMIRTTPIGPIFAHQNPDGDFSPLSSSKNARLRDYLPKYRATTWQVRFLAEAGVPKEDPRIIKLGNYVLNHMYSPEQGFFKDDLACVNADMVHALIKFGFEDNPKVKKAFDIQIKYQRFDNGDWHPPEGWPYYGLKGHCFGPNSCIIGIQTLLRSLTILPDSYWTPQALEIKKNILDFYQKHGVLDRKLTKKFSKSLGCYLTHRVYPNLSLTSPHVASNDVIEVITNLLKLGMKVDTLKEGIEYVLSKETKNKKWILENTRTNMYSSWGKIGKENKWITFRVLYMLKLTGRIKI